MRHITSSAENPARWPGPSRAAAREALQITRVSKVFGEREVLHGIDLAVQPGEFVAVIGRSGCGKSTLLRLVAGLDAPSAGRVTLDGMPVHVADPKVRIMFQDARLLPWKRVLDNVALGLPGERSELAARTLAEVGLGGRERDWPAVLSGGQRQRVALARALVGEPRLLLLDEPLGALDALTRIEMQALIERVWQEKGFAALLVTHDVSEAVALADRVIMIEAGRIALDLIVRLARPRVRSEPAFAATEGRILNALLAGEGVAAAAPGRLHA
jgi:sulfonate transport system ATP-binding protein